MLMFENDYTLNGKHATYMKYLVNDAKLFNRYIDVYMNGAVWGLLYGRISENDNSSDRARIYADAFANERDTCIFLYRMLMLLDDSTGIPDSEKVNRAFRYDSQPEKKGLFEDNMRLFHKYIRGGIEVLFEQLTEGCTNQHDYLAKAHDTMTNFKKELEGINYGNELEKLVRR